MRDLRNSRSLRAAPPAAGEDPSAEPQQQTAKLSKLKALSDADKDVIASLQTKIKEQQNELDNRTTTINAIQRNFEQLSTIALAERAELQKLREAASASSSTNAKRDKQTEVLREELRQLQADAEAQSTTSEEADGAVPLSIYPSVQVTNLETLASKFEFQKQALAAMATAAAAKAGGSRRGSRDLS